MARDRTIGKSSRRPGGMGYSPVSASARLLLDGQPIILTAQFRTRPVAFKQIGGQKDRRKNSICPWRGYSSEDGPAAPHPHQTRQYMSLQHWRCHRISIGRRRRLGYTRHNGRQSDLRCGRKDCCRRNFRLLHQIERRTRGRWWSNGGHRFRRNFNWRCRNRRGCHRQSSCLRDRGDGRITGSDRWGRDRFGAWRCR